MLRPVSVGLVALATLFLAGCSSEPAPGTEHQLTEEAKALADKANADPKATDPKAMQEGMMQPKPDPSTQKKPDWSAKPAASSTPAPGK